MFAAWRQLAYLALAALASATGISEFAQWHHRSADHDLFTFVTRPDLRPPKFNISLHKADRTAPGYVFVAPYDCLECSNVPATSHVTQQIGPHVYTQSGELIWSGSELFGGTKVFDFRPVLIDGGHHLSLVAPADAEWQPYPNGLAMVLNASYHPVFSLDSKELGERIDMHDFNVLNDGRTALVGMTKSRQRDGSGDVLDCLFTEIDLRTRERLFTWVASDHVPYTESSEPPPTSGGHDEPWDWFHLNSMDKDMFGNYLISARSTNAIYYVGPDGSVIWRLGGQASSFTQNFNFSRQGHARIRDQNEVNMVISFFDNAADERGSGEPTSGSSSMKVVGLDLESMTASLYHVHERPDGEFTKANGNIDFLPNGGVFGGWGENGYMTEYINRGGEMLYEASFASRRFSNHRAYKAEFVAQPLTKPVTKAVVSTNSRGDLRTAVHVSWNGATEVASWTFYSHSSKHLANRDIQIGQTRKTGFETSFIAMGYHPVIFVEALDVFGNSLANSSLEVTEIPTGFHAAEDPIYTSTAGPLSMTAVTMRPGADFVIWMAMAFIAGLSIANIGTVLRFWKYNGSGRAGPRPRRWSSKQKT